MRSQHALNPQTQGTLEQNAGVSRCGTRPRRADAGPHLHVRASQSTRALRERHQGDATAEASGRGAPPWSALDRACVLRICCSIAAGFSAAWPSCGVEGRRTEREPAKGGLAGVGGADSCDAPHIHTYTQGETPKTHTHTHAHTEVQAQTQTRTRFLKP